MFIVFMVSALFSTDLVLSSCSFCAHPKNSTQNNCTGRVEVSNTGTLSPKNFVMKTTKELLLTELE